MPARPFSGPSTAHARGSAPRPAVVVHLVVGLIGCLLRPAVAAEAPPLPLAPDFNRDIRPVLSENCFPCHGQDAQHRRAKLRLDTPEGGRSPAAGPLAILPGQPDASPLVRRITSSNPDELMPPPDSRRRLTESQIELLRRWISGGAPYSAPWAFQPPASPPLPAVHQSDWLREPLDAFVLARLEHEGLQPSPESTPATWLRRVGFDLVGLAPTPAELDQFESAVARSGEAAYRDAVDRLLASPRFGERQAQEWLDVARYADTHGFNNDTTRTLWRWRDWVIDAFNRNLPYDRFVTEQLAGDLLPQPTLDQRIATGFGRNHVVNSEGGIIDEEYRVEYVADRVRTLGLAWLGLTLECSRCHDHKFDPLSQADYYRLFAFFNNIDESGEDGRIGNAAPILAAPTPTESLRLARLDASLALVESDLGRAAAQGPAPGSAAVTAILRRRVSDASPPPPTSPAFALTSSNAFAGPAHPVFGATIAPDPTAEAVLPLPPASFSAAQPWTLATWIHRRPGDSPVVSTMDYLPDPSAGGYGRGAEVRVNARGQVEIRITEFWPAYSLHLVSIGALPVDTWSHLAVSYDGTPRAAGVRLYLDGRPADLETRRDGLSSRGASGHAPRVGRTVAKVPEIARNGLADLRLYTNVVAAADLQPWIEDRLVRWLADDDTARRTREPLAHALALRTAFPDYARAWSLRELLLEERRTLFRDAPQTMVMAERATPRPTFVLRRGRYDSPTEPVEPGVPEALLGPWPANQPRNRLGLARWLTQPDHPLVSRVVVNRFWAQLFGAGLVRTVEDFGAQGDPPTHPELLDHLARDFVGNGWDVKHWFRVVVLSATYRQASTLSASLLERDPANHLLARGPRSRLPAETLRDHALSLAGLLRHRLGGPSVFPPQPESLYTGVVVAADYPGTRWIPSEGDDRFRRSLYTFWKRTVPHPVMTTFDAPDREVCTGRRLPTNTPLQALALLNEPAFVQAGAALGSRARHEGGNSDEARLAWAFRSGTGRLPTGPELNRLHRTLAELRAAFATDPSGAQALAGTLAASTTATDSPAETATWAAVGGLILNLDETISKN